MRECLRSRRRRGLLPSRGYFMSLKRALLERAIKEMRPLKGKDNIKFERMALINSAGNRKRKITKTIKRSCVKRVRVQNDVDGCNGAMDYISQLPDCVMHNIMSFLHTREVARMSILSHRWRHVWHSFPRLDVDHRYFRQHGGDWVVKLKNYIDFVLNNCAAQRVNIDKFRLCVASDPLVRTLTDIWIEGAIERNIKELQIQVRSLNSRHAYSLPSSAYSASTIAVLSLYGCNLQTCNTIKLPLLQKLSLKKLKVSDQILQCLIYSCPLIEDLRLVECTALRHVNISALAKLQMVHIYQCKDLMSIKMEAPMLQSFWLNQSNELLGSSLNLEGCRTLRELVLVYPSMINGNFLDDLEFLEYPEMTAGVAVNYKFPFLEKFVFSKARYWTNMQISGEKLTKLAVRDCPFLDVLLIHAPQLLSLEYKGKDIPIILVGPTSLKEVNLYVKQANYGTKDCKYHDLLHRLDKSGRLKLLTYNKFEAIIQEDMSTLFPPLTLGVDLQTVKISASVDYLIESLLKGPKYPSRLSVFSHKGSKFHETIYEKFNAGRKDPNCCNYFKNKCWRHYLRGVTCKWSKVNLPQELDNSQVTSQPVDDWLKRSYAFDWATDVPSRLIEKLDEIDPSS